MPFSPSSCLLYYVIPFPINQDRIPIRLAPPDQAGHTVLFRKTHPKL